MSKPAPTNGQVRIAIDQAILSKIDEIRPQYMDRTTFVNFQLDQSIDKITSSPLTIPPSPPNKGGKELLEEVSQAVSTSKAVTSNKSITSNARVSSKTTRKEIPEELQQFADAIKLFWDHRTGKNTDLAWNGLLRELGKIQTHVEGGNDAVAEQLQKGAEAGWKSITLFNYLKNGLGRSSTPAQAKANMEAHYERMNNIVTPW